ncbi:multidrug effflux MFS transporter [Azospirillum halopraeferens]|uniref:multidrug effflux MFS transporter n=1 Tax=Azospirillum halopraeferens TaxID=34010 RepID=UPI000416B044|nr:multidrug effflux MFS transporter [Azospirillum halopraeferens]
MSVALHTDARRGGADLFLVFLIVALAPIGQMAIDIYVPSLPVMVEHFGTTRPMVQLSVSLYLVAFAIGQLIYGPLADALGRRVALLAGIGLFLAGGILAAFAGSIEGFIAARIVQGLGITAASVVMKAIAADRFRGEDLANVMTWMVVAWGMGPIVAPVIGAWLQTLYGWEYSLYFLIAYAAVLLLVVVVLYRETNPEPRPFRLPDVLRNSRAIYTDRTFLFVFLSMGLSYAVLLTFNLVAPFIVQTVLGLSPSAYGHIALLMGAMYFLGGFSNRLLPRRITVRTRFAVASTVNVVAAAAMAGLAVPFDLNLWVLVLPTLVMVFFTGVMYPNLMAIGVGLFPAMAGLTSSLLGFSLMLCAAVVMIGASSLQVASLLPLATLFLVVAASVRVLVLRTLR